MVVNNLRPTTNVDGIRHTVTYRLVYPEKVISALVKRADVNVTSPESLVPLDLTESPVTIRLLLEHGATPNYQQAKKCLPYNLLKDPIDMAINMFILGNQGVGKSTLAKMVSVEAKDLLARGHTSFGSKVWTETLLESSPLISAARCSVE